MLPLLLAASALAFTPGLVAPGIHAIRGSSSAVMMAKGFGKVEPKKAAAPKKPKVKSAGQVRRDAAGDAFEELKASGSPEYMVLVREVPEGQEPSKWYPVGGIAVPRSSSEDVALSIAIYNNEEDLLKGAVSAGPNESTADAELQAPSSRLHHPHLPSMLSSRSIARTPSSRPRRTRSSTDSDSRSSLTTRSRLPTRTRLSLPTIPS